MGIGSRSEVFSEKSVLKNIFLWDFAILQNSFPVEYLQTTAFEGTIKSKNHGNRFSFPI